MRLNRFLLTYLLLVITYVVSGQSFYKLIGTTGTEFAEAVINDRDSGFVIVGGTEGLGQGEMDGYMVKLDTAGNILWTRTFGQQNVDRLTGVVLLDDGMITCGYSNVQGDYQIYIIRTNEIGQVIWEKTYGNSNWDFPNELRMINDTTVMVVGKTYVDGFTTTDGFGAAISINGDSLWYQTYGSLYDDELERIILSDSNQIYVCGSYGIDEGNVDYWVGRINNQGTFLWQQFLGDTLNDYAHGITELITGEFVVTGGDDSGTNTNIDNKFYKLDSTGNILGWNILNNQSDEIGVDVISYPDTNAFYLVNKTTILGNGGYDTYVFDCNYSTYGNYYYKFQFGSALDDIVVDADTTFDKGLILVGNMYDPVIGNSIFVNKSNGPQNVLYTYQTEEDMAVEDLALNQSLIYPNPSQHEIMLTNFKDLLGETYAIFNVNGQVVQSGKIGGKMISIDVDNGYYFLRVGQSMWNFVVLNN